MEVHGRNKDTWIVKDKIDPILVVLLQKGIIVYLILPTLENPMFLDIRY